MSLSIGRQLQSWGQMFRAGFLRRASKAGFRREYFLILLAIAVGAATGLFAHLFYLLIEWARAFCFGDDGQTGLYAGRLWMLVLLPTVGGLIVGHITYYFAREAKGHGVPEVMDAMYRKGSVVRRRIAVAKAVTSAVTIGTGGSAGTEGPIVQIGAAIASSTGQFFKIQRRDMSVMVACGVSAGIAAIFNAPIAGVLFALEIFLKDFSFRTFSPVVLSSVISCTVVHELRSTDEAIFAVTALRDVGYVFAGLELPWFLVLGLLCALGSVAFIRTLYATEDLADRLPLPDPIKPALGAALLGVSGVIFVLITGEAAMPLFFGNGYPIIKELLGKHLLEWTMLGLVAVFALKLLATSLTLGSGGSGGVFAPSLLLGAAIGGGLGVALHSSGLIADVHVPAYALVGMAALVAGTTHAPLTAIVMTYEITREPKIVLPVMFAAIVATAGAQLLLRDSIYTLKLRRRGVRIGSVADLTILRRITASDVPKLTAQFIPLDVPLQELIDLAGRTNATDFVAIDEAGTYQGLVTGRDVQTALLAPEAVSLLLVSELVRESVPTVQGSETLDVVLDKFTRYDVESLPLAKPGDGAHIDGLITRRAALRVYHDELEKQMR